MNRYLEAYKELYGELYGEEKIYRREPSLSKSLTDKARKKKEERYRQEEEEGVAEELG